MILRSNAKCYVISTSYQRKDSHKSVSHYYFRLGIGQRTHHLQKAVSLVVVGVLALSARLATSLQLRAVMTYCVPTTEAIFRSSG